jgi:hypothetical protein
MAVLYWLKFDGFSYKHEKILVIVIPQFIFWVSYSIVRTYHIPLCQDLSHTLSNQLKIGSR